MKGNWHHELPKEVAGNESVSTLIMIVVVAEEVGGEGDPPVPSGVRRLPITDRDTGKCEKELLLN